MKRLIITLALALLVGGAPAHASVAYGSLNNFDTVNDTGQPCHGFEIEIEDIHSTDITYTYDWNHYGAPRIVEDSSNPLHPKTTVWYESKKNPDGSWVAFTSVPAAPINPTDGHQFTNPAVNFGGEHFGVGFYGQSSAVRYFWLVDDGGGNLVRGGEVLISTPSFVYYPPVNNVPAQVNAVVQVPPPPALPAKEFGDPLWVKVTRTETHNNQKVELRDLVSDDPDDPNDHNWKNGEPDEVEVEWQLMQTEFNQVGGGANGEVENQPQEIPDGDEIVTLRYDFFNYVGPIDEETGEAKTDNVGPDDLHGIGIKTINGVEVDLSTVVVVGDYIGAQMAGFDPVGQIGLIDHLQDGELDTPYVDRRIVIDGTAPVVTTLTGSLPDGMDFDAVTGILSGTPTVAGTFAFTVHSTDAAAGDVSADYLLTITDANVEPPHYTITTSASPVEGGSTTGEGEYVFGDFAEITAEASPGYQFVDWRENGDLVSTDPSFGLTVDLNHDFVANFELVAVETFTIATSALPVEGGNTTGNGVYEAGAQVTINAVATEGYTFLGWLLDGVEFSTDASVTFTADADYTLVAVFEQNPPTVYTISTIATPVEGGSTSGGAIYTAGDAVTVSAVANPGYNFLYWMEGGQLASVDASYSFVASGDRDLVAHLERITFDVSVAALPEPGGIAQGGGAYPSGEAVTVTAGANAGYAFVNWTEGGAVVSETNSYSFDSTSDRTLVANFARIQFGITVAALPVAGGSVAGGGMVNSGDSVTVSAVANPGYDFANWTEGGVVVSTSASYTFNATANRSLAANFIEVIPVTYTVGTSASPEAGGATSGGGVINAGASTTVSAVATTGYAFVNWTEGGAVVSTASNYTFIVNGDRDLVANFMPVSTTGTLSLLKVISPVWSGNMTIGFFTLTKPAPAGGLTVQLSSSNAAVHVPATATVPAGWILGTFIVRTDKVSTATSAKVTGTLGTSVKSSTLRLIPRR